MTTLTRAHVEWSKRAQDERYSSIADMHDKACAMYNASRTSGSVAINKLRAIADGASVKLTGPQGTQTSLSHWAFGQLATRANGPAGYLRSLPSHLAADCINSGLAVADGDGKLLLEAQDDGSYKTRAITSERYSRIWNCDITSRLMDIEADGLFRPAPAAFDGSRGLYLSDQDMFAFLVDNERRIFETLPGGGLSRGFFVWNSEVGSASVGICTFLYEYVCGNHRVWGAQNVKEVRLRHVGSQLDAKAFKMLRADLIEYANASADADELRIERMRTTDLGTDKQSVLDVLFNRFKITKKLAAQTYDLAETRVDWYGSPRSVWGVAGALTEIARDLPNASDRTDLEKVGARIMAEVAF